MPASAGLLVFFFAFLAGGMPIFAVLGLVSFLLFWADGESLEGAAQLIVDNYNSITLMAIPFFVMAATFMQRGGIAQALVDLASVWVGRFRGGLALVCVAATTVFAAICGSSVATALAMGVVLVPAMLGRNYPRPFALGVVGASGTLGILIPPSLAMVVYAIVAEELVPRLFAAGVIPGLMQAALFAAWIMYYARRHDLPRGPRLTRAEFARGNLQGMPALSMPIVVLGGLYSGIVTVTEVAALSAAVAIVLSVVFYRSLRLRDVIPIMGELIAAAATIMIIIAGALLFGHWITMSGLTKALVQWVIDVGFSWWQFLLFINVVMLFLGMFLEVIAIILITVPLVLPIMEVLHIDPIHYAIMLTINMELALLTPPVGLNLYVLTSISGAPIAETIKGVTPFIVLMVALLGLITYVPEISMYLPNLIFGPS